MERRSEIIVLIFLGVALYVVVVINHGAIRGTKVVAGFAYFLSLTILGIELMFALLSRNARILTTGFRPGIVGYIAIYLIAIVLGLALNPPWQVHLLCFGVGAVLALQSWLSSNGASCRSAFAKFYDSARRGLTTGFRRTR
jgi:hypothetical protein